MLVFRIVIYWSIFKYKTNIIYLLVNNKACLNANLLRKSHYKAMFCEANRLSSFYDAQKFDMTKLSKNSFCVILLCQTFNIKWFNHLIISICYFIILYLKLNDDFYILILLSNIIIWECRYCVNNLMVFL